AAYLSVFESLFNTLKTLSNEGYNIEVPANADVLRDMVLNGNREMYGADANVHHIIPASEHVRNERWLKQIEAQWGPAPGKLLTNGQGLFVQGVQLGQALVCIQPGFGYEGDPMRLLFEAGFAPTHAFSAFYRYLRQDFKADAVLHFGTHGALEFMPGKQSGLSGNCWPDRLIDDLPNLYFYASNNPSEGAIAKRRGSATLVSYLPPTFAESGLYKGLSELKQTLDRWRALDDELSEERNDLAAMIHQQAVALELRVPASVPAESSLSEPWINSLVDQLLELEYSLIPEGLHVIGQLPTRSQRLATLKAMAKAMEIEEPELLERLVDGVTEDQLKRSAKHLSAAQQDALHQLVHSNVLLN
ncbi:MAG: magnesium chelatase, partial [Betaproteobacteria bacterium]|nr:magnesium chelatase [Betaproteobacteria bacterium]